MNNDIIIKVYKRALIFSILVMGLTFFIFNEPKPIVLGYIFGLIISMLSFKLLQNTINNSVKMNPGRARRYTIIHYTFRSIIYLIVMIVAILADYLNFPATVLGILMVKFTIIFSNILDKNFIR